jgi:hypothetical protein
MNYMGSHVYKAIWCCELQCNGILIIKQLNNSHKIVEKWYLYNGNLIAQQIVWIGIIVDNYLQISLKCLMASENAYMWHDHMCWSLRLVAKKLLIGYHIYSNCNVIVTCH